uniref:PACT_coil_coil domain-containing protein n=1 Tax=Echinostoma caproni TaxID=27848 RepID=A0A183APW6_9TREM
LLEEKEKRKVAEEKLHLERNEFQAKDQQIARLQHDKETYERKFLQVSAEAQELYAEKQKSDICTLREKWELKKKSWNEEFSRLHSQLEQHKNTTVQQTELLNRELRKESESTESGVQVDQSVNDEHLHKLDTELIMTKHELEQDQARMKELELSQARISQLLKRVEDKLSDLMTVEQTVQTCLQGFLQEWLLESQSTDERDLSIVPEGPERLRAFLEILSVSKRELQHCLLQVHQTIASAFKTTADEDDEAQSSDCEGTTKTMHSTLLEQLASLSQKLASKEREAKALRLGLKDARREHKEQQSALQVQLNQTKDEIAELKGKFQSEQTLMVGMQKVLWTRFTQTELEDFSIHQQPPLMRSIVCRVEEAEHKISALSASASSSIGSIPRTQERSSSPVEQLQRSPIFHGQASPHHSTTAPSSPRCNESRRMCDLEPELTSLRRRVAELEADRDWLARENSRLMDRTEKQTRLTDKLATRLCQSPQTAAIPSSVYPGVPYAFPQPVMVPNPCMLTSSHYINPRSFCQSKHTPLLHDDSPITPQKRPVLIEHPTDNDWSSSKPSHTRPNKSDYPEVDQSGFKQSTWSLDQEDLEADGLETDRSANAQLLESRKSVHRRKLSDKLWNETYEQLKPELERSIHRHMEAAGEL